MATHAMIDIETLGTMPNSVVLTVGAVKFDPFTNIEPHAPKLWKLDIDEQDAKGRFVDDKTIEWWSKQDAEIQERSFTDEGRVKNLDFMKDMNAWLTGCDTIWAQGPQFDMVILENLYRQMKQPLPWNFWQVRDSRTLFSMMPQDPRKAIRTDAHNALADCYYQAKCVQQSFEHFKVTK